MMDPVLAGSVPAHERPMLLDRARDPGREFGLALDLDYELVDTQEAAEILGRSVSHLNILVATGEFAHITKRFYPWLTPAKVTGRGGRKSHGYLFWRFMIEELRDLMRDHPWPGGQEAYAEQLRRIAGYRTYSRVDGIGRQ